MNSQLGPVRSPIEQFQYQPIRVRQRSTLRQFQQTQIIVGYIAQSDRQASGQRLLGQFQQDKIGQTPQFNWNGSVRLLAERFNSVKLEVLPSSGGMTPLN